MERMVFFPKISASPLGQEISEHNTSIYGELVYFTLEPAEVGPAVWSYKGRHSEVRQLGQGHRLWKAEKGRWGGGMSQFPGSKLFLQSYITSLGR